LKEEGMNVYGKSQNGTTQYSTRSECNQSPVT
jgi:hypothetical protein